MREPITWTNEKRKLSELIPWEINPATIRKDEAKRLEESLDEFGQVQTIAISPTNEILDGHQRQVVWGASQKFGPEYEVDVRVSSRELTERERKKLVIFLRKGAVGEFDWDMLANNWEQEDLLEWGFNEFELGLKTPGVDYNAAWQGMPEFEQENVFGEIKSIMVHFASLNDIKVFSNLVEQTITEKTKFIWFPKQKNADLKSLVAHES